MPQLASASAATPCLSPHLAPRSFHAARSKHRYDRGCGHDGEPARPRHGFSPSKISWSGSSAGPSLVVGSYAFQPAVAHSSKASLLFFNVTTTEISRVRRLDVLKDSDHLCRSQVLAVIAVK